MSGVYDLFLFAGEPSADLHGEALIKELKKQRPHIKIASVAGPRMRAQGVECILPMEKFQVMGFIDVFLALPRLIQQFYFVADKILSMNPKAALFIDYPGFNLRMEKHLKRKEFQGKLIHYICPSVWVYGKGRIQTMEENLDELLCILPFEKECFANTSLKVTYVGHPLISRMEEHCYTPLEEIPRDTKVIALFPGSRTKEILRNLPLYLTLVKKWLTQFPSFYFAISISRLEHRSLILEMLSKYGLDKEERISLISSERTYDLMKSAYLALAKSGTVTLELALHKVPTVVTYAATKLDIFIAKDILKIFLPHYSLASILCKEEVFPELIGPFFTDENLERQALNLLSPKFRERCIDLCGKLQKILGKQKASQEVANHLIKAIDT